MAARRLNARNALAEGGFLVALMICGAMGQLTIAIAVGVAMEIYWLITRGRALWSMPLGARVLQTVFGSAVIVVCGALAYLLGASLRGVMTGA